MSGREEHQQEKTGLQGDLGQEPICSCLSLPSKAGLDLLLLCQEELFPAGTPHLVQSPKDSPAFAQPIAREQEDGAKSRPCPSLKVSLFLEPFQTFT